MKRRPNIWAWLLGVVALVVLAVVAWRWWRGREQAERSERIADAPIEDVLNWVESFS